MPPNGSALDIESSVFTRYLVGDDPSDYIRQKYRDGHRAIPFRLRGDEDAFDVLLVMLARRGSWLARIADAYARIFRPHGALRQKLTLLLAILENSPDRHRQFTSGGRGIPSAVLSIGGSLLVFLVLLLVGVVICGPMHLFLRGRRPPARVPA